MVNDKLTSDRLQSSDHYDFELPKELIAQEPLPVRTDSRLLYVNRSEESINHLHFRDIDSLLEPGDCLVLNDTRVIPAKLVGKRQQTGGRWEGLIVGSDDKHWKMMARTRGRIQPGETVLLQDRNGKPRFELLLVARLDDGNWVGRPLTQPGETNDVHLHGLNLSQLLQIIGRVPLPYYVRGGNMVDADVADYQTVYAQKEGAVAAPTAGLHFTQSLLKRLINRGINIATVTLHVGAGTFRPLSTDQLEQHRMHSESGSISQSAADTINRCRQNRKRVIAVGTTSVRLLESAGRDGPIRAWEGETDLFIKPGFPFQVIDGLLTNFHLPRSTLIVLVRTFGGDELIKQAYEEAIAEKYRFFSYGDAMLIM